ncbi:prepilin peptidase [Pelagibaculum spongiae]
MFSFLAELASLPLMAQVSIVFIFSLLVGSFLNVVIYRTPIMMERGWREEYAECFPQDLTESARKAIEEQQQSKFNIATPASRCPKCSHKISALENIPVISYLFLAGKCRDCKTPISARYPIIELATATISAIALYYFGWTQAGLVAVIASWILVAATMIDYDTQLLPDQLTLGLLWLALLASLGNVFVSPEQALIGAMAGYLSLWSVYWVFKLITGKEGMGYGDFKLLAALGALMGWTKLPVIILCSSLVGAVVGIALIALQGRDKSKPIPFGPFLAAAGWICLLWGDQIINFYQSYLLG